MTDLVGDGFDPWFGVGRRNALGGEFQHIYVVDMVTENGQIFQVVAGYFSQCSNRLGFTDPLVVDRQPPVAGIVPIFKEEIFQQTGVFVRQQFRQRSYSFFRPHDGKRNHLFSQGMFQIFDMPDSLVLVDMQDVMIPLHLLIL